MSPNRGFLNSPIFLSYFALFFTNCLIFSRKISKKFSSFDSQWESHILSYFHIISKMENACNSQKLVDVYLCIGYRITSLTWGFTTVPAPINKGRCFYSKIIFSALQNGAFHQISSIFPQSILNQESKILRGLHMNLNDIKSWPSKRAANSNGILTLKKWLN